MGPGWARGRVLAIDGQTAIVLPFPRHGHTERISLAMLKPWKAAQALEAARHATRAPLRMP